MSKKRGSAFIFALVVVTAASAILAFTVSRERVNVKASANRLEARRARQMAMAGIQAALSSFETLSSTGDVDTLGDWYSFGDQGDGLFTVGDASFRVQVADASSLVNLNTAPEEQLLNLNLTQEQIDCLLDWREAGDQPRADGAKNEYYNALTEPYNAKEGRLDTFDELLLIKDWLPTTLYTVPDSTTNGTTPRALSQLCTVESFSPNTDSTGQQRQNINNAQQQQLIQAGLSQQAATAIIARRNGLGSFSSMGQVLTTPGLDSRSAGVLLDRFSASSAVRLEGKINVNTATEEVLATLPGITTDIASSIVTQQSTGLTDLSQLLTVPGMTVQTVAPIADDLTVGSDTFLVRSRGTAGGISVCLEATVQVQNGIAIVQSIRDTPFADMLDHWGWSPDTTNETVLVEAPQ